MAYRIRIVLTVDELVLRLVAVVRRGIHLLVSCNKLLLTCVVCGGDAHGYNFDAISCESCKAFFRRNAIRPLSKFKCRHDGHCEVAFDRKRRCKKCRLEKCLQSGMRKEWILTENEKQEKRMKIEHNRRLRALHDRQKTVRQREPKAKDVSSVDRKHLFAPIDQSPMSETDWLTIDFIQNAYTRAVTLNHTAGVPQYPAVQPIESTLELFRIPIYLASMRLITYFKQIPEFQRLHKDAQLHLVKFNTLTIVFLHSISIYDPDARVYHEPNTTDPAFREVDWSRTINDEFHYKMKGVQADLARIIEADERIFKIVFLIVLFSDALTSRSSAIDTNSIEIFRIQSLYNELLYKYCVHTHGTRKASMVFLQLLSQIMKIQNLINEIRDNIHQSIDMTSLPLLLQSII